METFDFGFFAAPPSAEYAAVGSSKSVSSNLAKMDLRLRGEAAHLCHFCSVITMVPSSNMENLRRLRGKGAPGFRRCGAQQLREAPPLPNSQSNLTCKPHALSSP